MFLTGLPLCAAQVNAHLYLPTPAAALTGSSDSSGNEPAGDGSSSSAVLLLPSDARCHSLEVLSCFSFLLGSQAVLDEVEQMVMRLEVGGAAVKRQATLSSPQQLQEHHT
jgi:hypothetical protein